MNVAVRRPHRFDPAEATATLDRLADELAAWAQSVRPEDGGPGRFCWAVETTRPANIASTRYILEGLRHAGVLDRAWTDDDKDAAVAWLESIRGGGEQYRDPALFRGDRPDLVSDDPARASGAVASINQYARLILEHCGESSGAASDSSPPPDWPQADDDPERMLEWIRTRPYDQRAWGACSHGMRMTRFMLDWHKRGLLTLEPIVEAIDFFYSIQDPQTGLWGTAEQPRNVRINGAFKLLVMLREQLDLPLPHADELMDEVFAQFARLDYDRTVNGCDEWDNLYVLAMCRGQTRRDRDDELAELAARRLRRIPEIFGKPDGGLSFLSDHCQTHWLDIEMAPVKPQGDAMGCCILSCAIDQCVDFLGLAGRTSWIGRWQALTPEPVEIRRAIRERLTAV